MNHCLAIAFAVAAITAGAIAACGDSNDTTSPGPDASADVTADTTVRDGAADTNAPDAASDVAQADATDASDASAASDAARDASDAGLGGDATYNDFTNTSLWTTFDTTTVDAGAAGYWGGTFDGRYLYAPSYHNVYGWDGMVSRYDTQAAFTSGASWSTFNTKTVNSSIGGFYGAGFDGRYVYLVPPASGPSGLVARYDTQASFNAIGAWQTFDAKTVNAGSKGFIGSVFDGRYLYLVPYYNAITSYSGIVTRFDTQASFTSSSSWSTFDTSSLNGNAVGFYGGVFDGRYVYFVPDENGATGTIARYDTTASFGASASWSTFDIRTVDTNARGFQTGAFDGRYLYLVPGHGLGTVSIVARYDTAATFGTAASWQIFDARTVHANAKDFESAAFDGRYVYLVPHSQSQLVRYDTRAAFGTLASWQAYDLKTINAAGYGFEGAVFDGRYLYLLPSYTTMYSGVVFRFDAKSPPSMPALPAFYGSFL